MLGMVKRFTKAPAMIPKLCPNLAVRRMINLHLYYMAGGKVAKPNGCSPSLNVSRSCIQLLYIKKLHT